MGLTTRSGFSPAADNVREDHGRSLQFISLKRQRRELVSPCFVRFRLADPIWRVQDYGDVDSGEALLICEGHS